MSQYRIVWPDDVMDDGSTAEAEFEPVVLQFRVTKTRRASQRLDGQRMDVITRARLLFENRTCRSCGYPVVVPLELNDAQLNRNHLAVPGTATLVGFRCCGCRTEWSV